MNNPETLLALLKENAEAKTLSQLIPVITKTIALFHANEIDLPVSDVRRRDFLMYSPSVLRGRRKPQTHTREFTEVQIAELLGRLQDKGRGQRKADRAVTSAFAFLRQFEQGNLNTEMCEVLAKELSGRAQLKLARRFSKVQ